MIPNMKHEVEACRDAFPQAWKDAHTGNANTEDFIRILAVRLYKIDQRFGLNGKRGNPNDISDDVINFIGEGPGTDPITGKPVSLFDVITSAGAQPPYTPANPAPGAAWNLIDQPGPGAWVKPGAAVAPGPVPPVQRQQPYPDEKDWWEAIFDVEAAKRYAAAKPPQTYPNPRSARWSNRTAYDIAAGLTREASMAKHLAELELELGL